MRVFQGTSLNAYISAAGEGQFTAIYGDGTGITALGGVPLKLLMNRTQTLMFTDADASKLDGIEVGAEVNVVTSVQGEVGDVVIASRCIGWLDECC